MSIVHRLKGAAYGTHFADQIALVSVPLVATLAFDASPEAIGVLVACQSLAHLIGSIPFGVLVDHRKLRTLAIASALTALAGFGGAALSIVLGEIFWFGIAITSAGFGVVLFGLTVLSILPKVVGPDALAKANAAVEMPRALCSFVVPLTVGLVVSDVPAWSIFIIACIGPVFSLGRSITLPRFEVAPKHEAPVFSRILEGGRYVIGHPLLRPISLCSIFWNFAFAASLVVLVPVIQDIYRYDPGSFGVALSAFGLAAVLGSWLAGRFANRFAPSVLLLFGPISSMISAVGLLTIGSDTSKVWLYACFFLLGFGPSMWLITQNSVRQLVTPPAMLGRVNAVIQTAIYGVRPLGAVVGGVVTGYAGPEAGLVLVFAAYVASFVVSLFSRLRTIASYNALQVKIAPLMHKG